MPVISVLLAPLVPVEELFALLEEDVTSTLVGFATSAEFPPPQDVSARHKTTGAHAMDRTRRDSFISFKRLMSPQILYFFIFLFV
jgi:hypothetical protein